MMQEIAIRNVMISKQSEDSENYQEFLKIVKEKKIKVNLLEAGQRVNIEKSLYFDVLWPTSYKTISENPLNNNSLVCKMKLMYLVVKSKEYVLQGQYLKNQKY